MKARLLICTIIFFASCVKVDVNQQAAGDPYNQVTANISLGIPDHTVFPINASGNETVFTNDIDPNGDTVITITGSTEKSIRERIDIKLYNIHTAGSYKVGTNPSFPRQRVTLTYTESSPLAVNSTVYIGEDYQPASDIHIESLSDDLIKGSFTGACYYSGSVSINGNFQGKF